MRNREVELIVKMGILTALSIVLVVLIHFPIFSAAPYLSMIGGCADSHRHLPVRTGERAALDRRSIGDSRFDGVARNHADRGYHAHYSHGNTGCDCRFSLQTKTHASGRCNRAHLRQPNHDGGHDSLEPDFHPDVYRDQQKRDLALVSIHHSLQFD